jgi:pimeloyl-ACP methyl ester carboxylesterase
MERAGTADIQVVLFSEYISNLARYPSWQQYLARSRPKTLVLWGKNDPYFVTGALAYRRDVPAAEIHLLDGGYFSLEEHSDFIARKIIQVFAATVQP